MNTQSELIAHLKFLSGQDNLSETNAVRLLNIAGDEYTELMLTSDGTWQASDTSQDGLSRATATIAINKVKVSLNAEHLVIRQVSLIDSDGNESVLKEFDQAKENRVAPKSTETGKPTEYDYEEGHLRFNTYTDGEYTIKILYSKALKALEVGNSTQVVGIPSIHTEFLVLHAMYKLGFRTGDTAIAAVRNELELWKRRITKHYSRRNEDTQTQVKSRLNVIT